jgi:hypothetical protein
MRAQVSNALVSGPEVVRSTALHAVSNNPGLQPLLPYLVQVAVQDFLFFLNP